MQVLIYISYCLSSVETISLVELLLANYYADFVKAWVIPLCTVMNGAAPSFIQFSLFSYVYNHIFADEFCISYVCVQKYIIS